MGKILADLLPKSIRPSFDKLMLRKKVDASSSINKFACGCGAKSWRIVSTKTRKLAKGVRRACICLACADMKAFIDVEGVITPEPDETEKLRAGIADRDATIDQLQAENVRLADLCRTNNIDPTPPVGSGISAKTAKAKRTRKSAKSDPPAEAA